ncbi:MAG: hypothetical protein KME26_29735 [Oscillatoria princeps RMCB-10]|nr:hypothetical protein [Oscillatoria princeps RMCB-10]
MIKTQHERALPGSAATLARQPAVTHEGGLAGAGEESGDAGTVLNKSTAIKT